MPILFQDFRANNYSRRHTVYSKIKRVTDNGYDTSNDFFGNNFTGNLLGLTDDSKDFFSSNCNDIISFSGKLVACGQNTSNDKRSTLSTFLYSTDDGVSWAFGTGTFPDISSTDIGVGNKFLVSNNTLFCIGIGSPVTTNRTSIMTSTDGVTWTTLSTPGIQLNTDNNGSVTNGTGTLLVTDVSSNRTIMSSVNNGGTFSVVSSIQTLINNEIINDSTLYYCNNMFYAQIQTTQTTTQNLYFLNSSDGINWSAINGITIDPDYSIMFSANGITFLFNDINVLYYSTNGTTFQATSLQLTQDFVLHLTYNAGTYYIITYLKVISSTDGITWNILYYPSDPNEFIYDGYVDTDSIKLVIGGEITNIFSGLRKINFDGSVSFSPTTTYPADNINKIYKGSSNIIVGSSLADNSTDSSGDNTIYYQGPNDTSLQATEHQDDV